LIFAGSRCASTGIRVPPTTIEPGVWLTWVAVEQVKIPHFQHVLKRPDPGAGTGQHRRTQDSGLVRDWRFL
jgi:hypothetical protein